jgi:hypothetical protein
MKLIIGCPIYKREWIFPLWAAAIERQSVDLSDIGFIFETSPDDEGTLSLINSWLNRNKNIPFIKINVREDIPHFEHKQGSRQWTLSKYENMIRLRNHLLQDVREAAPDYYFSLDSDIIIKNPSTIELLINHIKEGADAVSPLMFMTPFGTQFPSVMTWKNDGTDKAFRRSDYPLGTYFQSDIIMAAKMMSKEVYENVNYKFHVQGEDLGWCMEAKEKGYKLYSASYIYAPHVMHREALPEFVKNGDNREQILFENHIKI